MRKLKLKLFGGNVMKNIFAWASGLLAGSLLGFIGGILLIAWDMVIDPDGIIRICEKHAK